MWVPLQSKFHHLGKKRGSAEIQQPNGTQTFRHRFRNFSEKKTGLIANILKDQLLPPKNHDLPFFSVKSPEEYDLENAAKIKSLQKKHAHTHTKKNTTVIL